MNKNFFLILFYIFIPLFPAIFFAFDKNQEYKIASSAQGIQREDNPLDCSFKASHINVQMTRDLCKKEKKEETCTLSVSNQFLVNETYASLMKECKDNYAHK